MLNVNPARNKAKAVCLNRWSEITVFLPGSLSVAENQITRIQPALDMKIEPSVRVLMQMSEVTARCRVHGFVSGCIRDT